MRRRRRVVSIGQTAGSSISAPLSGEGGLQVLDPGGQCWSRSFCRKAHVPVALVERRRSFVDRVDGHQHDSEVFSGGQYVAHGGGQEPFAEPGGRLARLVAWDTSDELLRCGPVGDGVRCE